MTVEEDNNDNSEITLESVVEVAPEDLSDEQKTFLSENEEDLTDEQKETFKDAITKEEEEEEDVDPKDVKPETRREIEKKKEEEEDDDTDPNDEAMIGKVVDKKMSEISDALVQIINQ